MGTIGMSDLADAIQEELETYLEVTTEQVRETVEETTQEAVDTLKRTSPKCRGKYARSWTAKTLEDTPTGLSKAVHNRVPGLTHLLENGHAKANGGRVSGIPHIKPVEEEAVRQFENRLREKLCP